jgi:uncharacterized protein (TIGR02996 family)
MKLTATGFWKAIVAEPDEDTHRLVLADWLDDQGDSARAEFIRAQCALAQLDGTEPGWLDHKIREQLLLAEHRETWLEDAPKWTRRKIERFRRGFASGFRCAYREYLRCGTSLSRDAVIEDVELHGERNDGTLDTLARSPHLPRLRYFTDNSGPYSELARLLPAMTGLQELKLLFSCLSDPEPAKRLMKLLQLPSLRSLRRLEVNLGHVFPVQRGGDVARRLGELDLPALTSLMFHAGEVRSNDLAGLLSGAFVPNLRELVLPMPLRLDEARVLAGTKALSGLRRLRIACQVQSPEALEVVLNSPHLAGVTALHLKEVCDAHLPILAQSTMAPRLRTLHLEAIEFRLSLSPQGIHQLIETGQLVGLWRLGFSHIVADGGVVELLARTDYLPALRYLLLIRCLAETVLPILAARARSSELRAVCGDFFYPEPAQQHERLTWMPERCWWEN